VQKPVNDKIRGMQLAGLGHAETLA